MLKQVKSNLGITTNFQDDTIQGYINEVILHMIDGGVSEKVARSNKAIGVITRGVSDLWNYGSGGTSLSPYFYQRVTQLAFDGGESDE